MTEKKKNLYTQNLCFYSEFVDNNNNNNKIQGKRYRLWLDQYSVSDSGNNPYHCKKNQLKWFKFRCAAITMFWKTFFFSFQWFQYLICLCVYFLTSEVSFLKVSTAFWYLI